MSNRKLAAVLFADIVGYTALMQKDDATANVLLDKFHQTLNTQVTAHKGQVINNYGDGCVCTFDSAVNAMRCAKEVQTIFQQEPIVPVRIGLHSGDVLFKENNVYGDSVNIASRIESLGVAGAVLFSERIKKNTANHPEFEVQSLGTFEFKNVEEPMEVFALANEGFAVPKKGEMQGKGKATFKSANKLWYFLIPILLLVSAFGIYQWQESTVTSKISADIRNERIAVLPFKNNTNDADLDILGDMSADWINRGLMEMEDVEVTSPFTVRSNLGALGIAPNDPQGRRSFSELTGAQNMLSGNYYEQNGDIIFQLQIESAADGHIRFIFDPIRGPEDDKEALLTQLGSQVAGYWVAREMVDTKNIKAPNYEAYIAYQRALLKLNSGADFAKVFELDSSFYLARIHFLNSNRLGFSGNNFKQFDFLDRHASELSVYESAWHDYLKALYLGNTQQAFESLNKLRKKYPKDFILNHETAVLASEAFNNPELALEIYNDLPIEEVDATLVGIYYNNRVMHQVLSFLKLEQHSNLSAYLNTIKVSAVTENSIYILALLTKALAEKNLNEINKAYAQFLTVYEYDKSLFFYWMFNFLNSAIGSPIKDRLRNDILSNYQKMDSTDFIKTFWKPWIVLLEGKSQIISLKEIKRLPKAVAIGAIYTQAVISINNNDRDKAYDYINELMEYTSADYEVTSLWGAGSAHYLLGKIFVKMGKPDDAIRHLKESRKLGKSVYLSFYRYDIELASLVGIPEFDALTDPIWPEMKD